MSVNVNCKEKKPKSKLDDLLNSSSSSSSSENDDNNSNSSSSVANNVTNILPVKRGIYSQVIKQTQQSIKIAHSKFDRVDKKLIPKISEVDKENTNEKKKLKKKTNKNRSSDSSCTDSNDSSNDDDDDSSNPTNSKSISSLSSKPSSDEDETTTKKEKLMKSSSSPSPPPRPTLVVAKKKRKSSNVVDRQFKEFDKIKNAQPSVSFNSSAVEANNNNDLEDEILSFFTVRVSMKTGVQRFEIKNNDQFLKVYEEISKIENTGIENIMLMLKDRKIEFHDTPESIDLQVIDILEFNKINGKKQERIQIIETTNEEEARNDLPNQIVIKLQTSEGRKSRVSFLVFKDESFGNILKKYCEIKEFTDWQTYMMEFDGDKVELDENSTDLDLEGGEIFDVKKSSGASLDTVKMNKINYEFDDDILIA